MLEIPRTPENTLPSKPGSHGRGAVFTCPVCGSRFVRTMAEQSKCPACLGKEKSTDKYSQH